MTRNSKLFRAIVVMGAAMAASACGDPKCGKCTIDAKSTSDAVATSDASPTDGGVDGPGDAPVDVVLIL